MEKKLIKKKGKKIIPNVFIPKNNKKEGLAFVTFRGISVEADKPNLSKYSLDYNLSNKIKDAGFLSCSFNWFATSTNNKDIKNLFIKEYAKEAALVLNFLKKDYGIKEFIIITNSFGSVPIMNILKEQKFNIIGCAFMGPIFKNSYGSLKWRLGQKQAIAHKLLNKCKNIEKERTKILNDYKENTLDYNLRGKYKNSIVFIGEFEGEFRREEILEFCKENELKLLEVKKAGHTVYWAEDKEDKKLKETEEKIHNFIFSSIMELINE